MTALALKLIACFSMLLDHIGYCGRGLTGLRIIGRIAFPIYVFLLTEGFRRTSDRNKYAFRLGLFAILAQVPFSLMVKGKLLDPSLNVMVTLLAAFLSIWLLESVKPHRILRLLAAVLIAGLCLVFDLELIKADYGAKGILLALVFYYMVPLVKRSGQTAEQCTKYAALLVLLAFLAVFHWTLIRYAYLFALQILSRGKPIPAIPDWTLLQSFFLLSIPLILSYNGKAGWKPQSRTWRMAMQYAFYAFYPIHMLVLCWIF